MEPIQLAERRTRKRQRVQTPVIDCDIHNAFPSNETLYKYLPARWRRHHETIGLRGHYGGHYPRAMKNAARHDAWPPNGLPPGSDLAFMRAQLLDAWDLEYGILNPLLGAGGQLNLEFGAALARATNEWQLAEWVEPEPRLRASIVVPYEDSALAAQEIERWGGHPGFVQVLLIARTAEPLGRRKYWPIYEAAVRHDLPIGIHFGGAGGGPITGAGFPSHYIEDHAGMPQAFQAQVISLVCEGVFERFPTLKIVLIEGGFAWLPPLAWRLDQSWRRLKEEVPYLRRAPSEYIHEHFWITTQPMEEPPKGRFFRQLLEQLNADDRLMFATDYPHWDFDAPDRAFPVELPPALKRKIMAENARALYKLPPRHL
ncbi:amidohydrolase family protein [Litorilinea aerophila]|uniref:Amidohydrolase n=1 Tax=Litorilinea aerophila TaxID=1204385 RepID=A0A540VG70_9CHLR|nr:amidohydrolase family protein [Litorilinea aerophila]MCC9076446.1 amidohydrolase family protein [Litorilinea aerophila]OUC07440.1 hydrolase [Litorilinea aerophila]